MIYDSILKNLDLNNRIKIIKLSNYIGYYLLNNKSLWKDIEIYNLKGYKYIFDYLKEINNKPEKIICISSGKIKVNLDGYNLSSLNHLDLSNSKITYNNLIKILYNCKLRTLFLKRLNFHSLIRHISNSQKDTLEQLDLSICKKNTYNFNINNLSNIYQLNNLKVLKINNNLISLDIFMSIIEIKSLEELEIRNIIINHKYVYCICHHLNYIIPLLSKLKKLTITDNIFCQRTTEIMKIKLKYNLII